MAARKTGTKKRAAPKTRGERVCAFIEKYCYVPEGDLIGQRMRLEPFQRKFILDVYDNPHQTHSAYLSLGKKNGKTSLIAGILLAHIAGPEAVLNSQIVSGAMSKEQAGVLFELAAKMVRLSPVLSGRVHIAPSGKKLTGLVKNVVYKALAAEGKTAHGISPILVLLDEVGQIKGPTDPFVAALTSAQGAYSNALLLVFSTQAPTDGDMLSIWIDSQINAPDPRVVCHLYAADPDCELDDREQWKKANPALGIFRSETDVEKQIKQAIAIPSKEPEVRNLILNQRVEYVSPFISKSVWERNSAAPRPIAKQKLWGGLDLSAVSDLTALVGVTEEHDVHPVFWLPSEGLADKAKKDRVPYDLWEKQGHIIATPGAAIEYEYVAEYLRGVFDSFDVQAIAFDRYNMKFLRPWLVKAGFSERELEKFVEFGQGFVSMTPALRETEVKLTNGLLRHGGHPVLTMCAMNARVVGEGGARKLDKVKSRGRIDGMVALAMAIGSMPTAVKSPEEPKMFFI
jgi:phage terminase large subunit-like protein